MPTRLIISVGEEYSILPIVKRILEAVKAINTRTEMTEREREEFAQEKTIAQLQADYQLKYREMELELKRVETRWTQVFRIPFAILMLPVRFLMTFAIIASAITKKDLPPDFWKILSL